MSKDVIKKVADPLIIVEDMRNTDIFDVVRVSEQRPIGEIIEIHDNKASVQAYEETSGLGPGESMESTGVPMSVGLGPGLIGSIYDGIQHPLDVIMEKTSGNLLDCGVEVPSLKREKKLIFVPTANVGDKVGGGDIIGTVQETEVVQQKIMVPVGVSGTPAYISGEEYTVTDTMVVMTGEEEQGHPVSLVQKQSVCKGRPCQRKPSPGMPLVTGQRVISCLLLIAKGGVAAVPGPFGSGKTVVQYQLAKWVGADIVVYIGCSKRGNEMTNVLNEFLELKDPKAGKSLMERTMLIVNISDIPVAARETSIHTGITIAEYFRGMGYSVALMTGSTLRWTEVLREMSGRLKEMPSEGGYPAYLGSRLAQFYECADRVISLGQDNREGVLSVVGAVSPAGGGISESVIQATLHIIEIFWSLDADLAYKRHFPAINWLTSYSLYVDTMEKWFNVEVESDWAELRVRLMQLLQEESELNEIVQLVGMDALSAPDRLKLEATHSIRGDFLHQNVFHEIGTFTSLKKQHMTMMLMMIYYDKAGEALAQGVNIERLVNLPVCETIGRFEYTEKADLDRVYEDVIKTLESEIYSEMSRKEDF